LFLCSELFVSLFWTFCFFAFLSLLSSHSSCPCSCPYPHNSRSLPSSNFSSPVFSVTSPFTFQCFSSLHLVVFLYKVKNNIMCGVHACLSFCLLYIRLWPDVTD
jgi:hypothetical protein